MGSAQRNPSFALKAAERGLSNLFDFQDGADSPLTIAPEVFVGFRPEAD